MSHDLTLQNATYAASASGYGQALTGGYGKASSTPLVGRWDNGPTTIDWTIEFFLTIQPGGHGTILNQSGAMELHVDVNGNVGGNFPQEYIPGPAGSKADGVRRHYAFTFSTQTDTPGNTSSYLDGILIGQDNHGQVWGQFKADIGDFFIGAKDAAGTDAITGIAIEELVMTRGIKYPGSFTPPTAPVANSAPNLLALYHFDGNGIDSAGLPDAVVPVAPVFSSAVADNLSGGGIYVVLSDHLYDWTQSNALHAAPPTSAFTVTGDQSGTHTFTDIVADAAEGRFRLHGVSPYFKTGENITIAYTAPSDGTGFYDVTGSVAVVSFTAKTVANNVQVTWPDAPTIGTAVAGDGYVDVAFTAPAYNGGAAIDHYTVQLSTGVSLTDTQSPIRVVAANGVAVTAKVSAHNAQGDSAWSSDSNIVTRSATPQQPSITVPGAPTSVIATAGNASASVAFAAPASNGGAAITGYTVKSFPGNITASGAASPITVPGLNNGTTYTFTVAATNSAGTGPASTSSNSVMPILGPDMTGATSSIPIPSSFRIKTVGAGKDFANANDASGWLYNEDLVANGGVAFVVFENQTMAGVGLTPKNSDALHYALWVPAAGLGVMDLDTGNALDYGTQGIELVCGTNNNDFGVNVGVKIQGFRIHLADGAGGQGRALSTGRNGWSGLGSYDPYFLQCRFLIETSATVLGLGGYNTNTNFDDCVFIQQKNLKSIVQQYGGALNFNGCTFARRAGTYIEPIFNTRYVSPKNCAFANCGNQLCSDTSGDWGVSSNNATDTAITAGPSGGFVVGATVQNAASNLLPAPGGVLLGGADMFKKYTLDARNKNRGASPDIGAAQLVPAPALVKATITQETVDGQSVIVSGTLDQPATSATGFLESQSYGVASTDVQAISIDNTALTFAITFDNPLPGTFLPNFTFVNAGGPAAAYGASQITLLGLQAAAVDSGQSGTGGGVTPTPTGPTVSIATADTAILIGQRATISGAANLQGDNAGKIELFRDPVGGAQSTTPIASSASGTLNVSNGTWTAQVQPLAVGAFTLRAVATANSQTASAQTGALRVLGAVASVAQLPG